MSLISRFNYTKGNKNKCFYCGQEEECTKDHFFPKSKKGRIMVYACQLCQGAKKDLLPMEFVKYIENHLAVRFEIKERIKIAVTSLLEILEKENEKLNH
jgi:5-methylcytosine-specific restriction endonuclease McrA